MNRKYKGKYFFAIYSVLGLLGIILIILAPSIKDSFWQAVIVNLATNLFGVVIVFLVVDIFFLARDWDLSEKVEILTERLESIEQAVNRTFLEKFSTIQQRELERKLEKASDLLIVGVALDRTISDHYSSLQNLLARGGKIRVILEKPDPNNSAIQMTVKRRKQPTTIDGWLTRVKENISALEGLKQNTGGDLQVRLTNYHLSRGGIFVDPTNKQEGTLFIWLYSFQVEGENEPKFILYHRDKWYHHFVEEVEKIWYDAR